MSLIENLLLLYIGALSINLVLSGVLYYRRRTPLHGALLQVWGSSVLTFGVQGGLSNGTLPIIVGFSSAFLVSAALVRLLSNVVEIDVPWRAYFGLMGLGLALGIAAAIAELPFEVAAMPIAIGVAAPILHTAFVVRRNRWKELSTTARALLISSFVNAVHLLDFPLLRDRPEMAPIGFTVALLIVFVLSITTPGVVLERVAEERHRIAELDRVKTQFFNNISHDLRTPLTVILAGLEQKQFDLVQRNAVRLLRLIDELLDLSKIDAGGLRLNIADLSVQSLSGNVCESHRPLATNKAIDLVFTPAGPDVPDMFGDPHRLEMVLANLVGNALKYTPQSGRIEVRVGAKDGGAFVSVSDNGPGIAAEDLPKVFERFYQVSRGDRRKGGVGIGLALAKELTAMHDGSLTVESELGKGSTFTLWLPKGREHFRAEVIERRKTVAPTTENRRAEDVATPTPLPEVQVQVSSDITFAGRRPRILVVEDQDDLRDLMIRIFSPMFDVTAARDGEEGWQRVEQDRPDLVVSDVVMPRRLGTELCRMIKGHRTLRSTPVILLTARMGSEATLEAYAHGADDFVAKPFHPQVLMARVRAQLQIRSLALQLTSQERLAAVGTLAAGIAHEVKNPLNFILNAVGVLKSEQDPELKAELLELVSEGAKRIDEIASAMSNHARPSDTGASPAPIDLREGLESTLRLLSHRMSTVELTRDYATEQKAWAPPGPVNQVLMNLLDNAVRSGASKIWVRVKTDADRVSLLVGDNGPGVPDRIADRIFDPFFTTRAPGEGTGLGLYLSRKIATDCGGTLTLIKRAPGGTEFQLDLPQAA
jgi:signal transduction histidine kinase